VLLLASSSSRLAVFNANANHQPTGTPVAVIVEAISARSQLMGIIGWIIFGLIVGIVAKFLMPGRDPGGFVITTVLGIVGAVLGGFLGRAVGWYGPNDPVGFLMAVLGAIVLLVGYRMVARRPRGA
jgi:uncharacterized membrane protein YeaQ/YmgE (transglycosylase-associated protein family)